MSRFLKIVSLTFIGALSSTAAQASCNNSHYCGPGSQFKFAPQSYSSAYSAPAPSFSNSTAQIYNFTGSATSFPGLGHNESLRPTTCPTAVHNPEGGQVLGCYNVVKAVPQTTYYRVVRPVIYVRYPVPTPIIVPTYNSCSGGHSGHHLGGHHFGGHHFGGHHAYNSCH